MLVRMRGLQSFRSENSIQDANEKSLCLQPVHESVRASFVENGSL